MISNSKVTKRRPKKSKELIDWFNGISTALGLFYALSFRELRSLFVNIYFFFVLLFLKSYIFCARSHQNTNIFVWPTDETLADIVTAGECGRGNNGNKGILHSLQISTIQFTKPIDLRRQHLFRGVGSLQRVSWLWH